MDIPRELVEQFARGNGVIFVGAGLSQGAGLPGWADLVRELAAELDGCPPDADYRDIAQYYDIEYGRRRLVERLRDRLDTLDVHPTPVHKALVGLPVSAIFTTNYDDLLEQALRAAKRPFTPVVGNVDASFWSADRLQLVKLHGDLGQPESIAITTEDYERFIITRKSLADILKVTLQTRTVLFLGYSATDPDLRLILTQVREESGRFARNLYTVQFGVPRLTVRDLERRGLKVVDLGQQPDGNARNAVLLEWLQELSRQVDTEAKRLLRQSIVTEPRLPVERLADEVASWLEARGYTIHGRQRREDWAVDITAELPEGVLFLVRCVDGEVDLRRVQELWQECAERVLPLAWIIADKRVAPSAREYALKHRNIRVFNLADFMRDIFGPYFDYLTRLVEESDIPRYYVDLGCEKPVFDAAGREVTRDRYEIIDEYVEAWLRERGKSHLSILGDFGSGKTWFCRHFAYKQLQRYLTDPAHQRIPLLITLRDYARTEDVRQLITDLLSNRYRVRIVSSSLYDVFDHLNRSGRLLLIFDGFDEMARKMDDQTMVDNFWKLAEVVVPESKVILTCRTPYFRYSREAREVLQGQRMSRVLIDLSDRPEFEIIHLQPFGEKQIREVLRQRLGQAEGDAALARLGQIHDLRDLATRPVLLDMIAETIGRIEPGQEIKAADLYRLYTDRWLSKNIEEERTFTSRADKIFFMEELAWEMYRSERLSIHYSELPERILRYFELERAEELDYFDYDLRTQSFLQRDRSGNYFFAHKSFMEYFVACKICREISAGNYGILGSVTSFEYEIWQFLDGTIPQYDIDLDRYALVLRDRRSDWFQRKNMAHLARLLPKRENIAKALIACVWDDSSSRYPWHSAAGVRTFLRDAAVNSLVTTYGSEIVPLLDQHIADARRVERWRVVKALSKVRKRLMYGQKT